MTVNDQVPQVWLCEVGNQEIEGLFQWHEHIRIGSDRKGFRVVEFTDPSEYLITLLKINPQMILVTYQKTDASTTGYNKEYSVILYDGNVLRLWIGKTDKMPKCPICHKDTLDRTRKRVWCKSAVCYYRAVVEFRTPKKEG